MKISVIGTGYVGLVSGACFSEKGNQVCCIDVDEGKLAKLRSGDPVIYEPGLEKILKNNIDSGRISFSSRYEDVLEYNDVVFLAVGTPTDDVGEADLTDLFSAAKSVSSFIKDGTVVVNKCTAPVGTVDEIRKIVEKESKAKSFYVASNPEFLKEGSAVDDFLYPDRIVLGVNSSQASNVLKSIYEPFLSEKTPVHLMDIRSAELCKYACNCFLATKISFMNDIAELCERSGADIEKVRLAMSSDERIGKFFLLSGVGYGGSCLPKDVKALISKGSKLGVDLGIVKATDSINEAQRLRFLNKIIKHFNNELRSKVISVWGLAFKPNTDDMREAPSVPIIEELVKMGAVVRASDPVAMDNAKNSIAVPVDYFNDHISSLEGADALVLVTEWDDYKDLDFIKLKDKFKGKVIFDGRNIWDSKKIKELGYEYYGVGR